MTREEAKYHVKWIPHFDGDKFIDEIYDGFKNKTCENCKWYTMVHLFEHIKHMVCRNEEVGDVIYDHFGKDFGCNKWEAKE